MNKKNKVLLTIMGLVVLTGIAATSSTFAWFTTVRSASVSFSNATVETQDNDLSVHYLSSLNTMSASTNDYVNDGKTVNNVVLAGVNKVTDISGDGINFLKPVWKANTYGGAQLADRIDDITLAAAGSADGYLIDFTLRIARGAGATSTNDLNVYFDEGTAITAASVASADEQTVKAVRMAAIKGGAPFFYYAPEAEDPYNYLTKTGVDTDVTYGVEEYDDSSELSGVVEGEAFAYYPTVVEAAADSYLPFLTLTTAAPSVDVTFRFWIEGEDVHAVNAAIGGVFNIALKMYALPVIV